MHSSLKHGPNTLTLMFPDTSVSTYTIRGIKIQKPLSEIPTVLTWKTHCVARFKQTPITCDISYSKQAFTFGIPAPSSTPDPSYVLTVGQFFINGIVEVLWRIRIGARRRTDEYGGIPEHRETTVVVGSRLHVNHLWRKYQSLPEETKFLLFAHFIQISKRPATRCVHVSCPQRNTQKGI